MSKLLLCCLITTLTVLKANAQINNDKLTFNNNVSIAQIIDRLQTVYKYRVSYEADINTGKVIHLVSRNISLDELMRQVEMQANVGMKNIGGNLVIKKLDVVTVSGVVYSGEDNLPLIGVTISSNKQMLGISNAEGKFNIRVTSGANVTFSMLGFEPQTTAFAKNTKDTKIVMGITRTP